jgi:biotin carboxyl carrier protein
MVARKDGLPRCFFPLARCRMKSYWIVAAAFSIAWPSGSIAYAGSEQSKGDQAAVQQAQAATAQSSPAQAAEKTEAASPATASAQNKSSYLLVELSKTLKAKKLKPGDKVKAEISQDVVSHGKVIIPMETELIGHVTEVCVRDGANPESRLGFVFDKILLKHYRNVKLQAVVQAVAPPMQKKSRVDEPSQMLPPAMMMGDLRQSSPGPAGGRPGVSTGRANTSPPPSTAMSESTSAVNFQAPLTVKQSPSTHTQTGGSAARLEAAGANGQSISVGTPKGITGMKGLSLTAGASASTPGPVIISNSTDVKLESGTQILLHILSVEVPQEPEK